MFTNHVENEVHPANWDDESAGPQITTHDELADTADSTDFDESFAAYVDTVEAHAITLVQICDTIFVVQGWNARFNAGTVSGIQLTI
jgi:hypothetical protein